jgi:hypothetical protein
MLIMGIKRDRKNRKDGSASPEVVKILRKTNSVVGLTAPLIV